MKLLTQKVKGGPVYEVGSSINRVYNPCRVIRQNAALSGCNRFFSNKAAVGNIFKRYKEIVWTFWITIMSLKLKLLKRDMGFHTIGNRMWKRWEKLESTNCTWPSFCWNLWCQKIAQMVGGKNAFFISLTGI